MNATERIIARNRVFRDGRGRTADERRAQWLRTLRSERKGNAKPFYTVVNGFWTYESRTIRQGKILGLSILNELKQRNQKGFVEIYDKATMVRIWETER